jgi:hypothetical protein
LFQFRYGAFQQFILSCEVVQIAKGHHFSFHFSDWTIEHFLQLTVVVVYQIDYFTAAYLSRGIFFFWFSCALCHYWCFFDWFCWFVVGGFFLILRSSLVNIHIFLIIMKWRFIVWHFFIEQFFNIVLFECLQVGLLWFAVL